jgi:hypothetical protein
VLAAWKKDREDIQVRVREQPVIRLFSSCFGGAYDRAQVLAASHAVEMIEANPGEAGDFLICKELLTRFNGDHFDPPSLRLYGRSGFLKIAHSALLPSFTEQYCFRSMYPIFPYDCRFANKSNERL